MKVDFNGYNIPIVTLSGNIALNTPTVVGTAEDFSVLLSAAAAAGVIRVKARINSVYMNGALIVSPYESNDGIEMHTISMAGAQAPYILFAQLVLDGSSSLLTVTLHSIS